MELFEILFILNITGLFYLAFDYIPRLERDVEKSYERLAYLEKIKDKNISGICSQEVDDAIKANKSLIKSFTKWRSIKVYLPLFLLAFPLFSILLTIAFSAFVPSLRGISFLHETWSLMLFFGVAIPFVTTVKAMALNRPYSRYMRIRRKIDRIE